MNIVGVPKKFVVPTEELYSDSELREILIIESYINNTYVVIEEANLTHAKFGFILNIRFFYRCEDTPRLNYTKSNCYAEDYVRRSAGGVWRKRFY